MVVFNFPELQDQSVFLIKVAEFRHVVMLYQGVVYSEIPSRQGLWSQVFFAKYCCGIKFDPYQSVIIFLTLIKGQVPTSTIVSPGEPHYFPFDMVVAGPTGPFLSITNSLSPISENNFFTHCVQIYSFISTIITQPVA